MELWKTRLESALLFTVRLSERITRNPLLLQNTDSSLPPLPQKRLQVPLVELAPNFSRGHAKKSAETRAEGDPNA